MHVAAAGVPLDRTPTGSPRRSELGDFPGAARLHGEDLRLRRLAEGKDGGHALVEAYANLRDGEAAEGGGMSA